MAEAALKIEVREPAPVRRFELADLSKHGPWLLKRFGEVFPDMNEKGVASYLSTLLYDNTHQFLYQDHAVSLAQYIHNPGIRAALVVQERFVWVEDKADKDQLEAAADFYTHMQHWAKRLNAVRLQVCESSDVPKTLIEARIGRVFDTKVSYVRV